MLGGGHLLRKAFRHPTARSHTDIIRQGSDDQGLIKI